MIFNVLDRIRVYIYQLAISYFSSFKYKYILEILVVLGFFFNISNNNRYILGMHYVPNMDLAFKSVEHIMRDVNFG